jgi:hypothetical protein
MLTSTTPSIWTPVARGVFTSTGVDFDNTDGSITTGGGDATIIHTGIVTIGAAVVLGAGDMRIVARGDVIQSRAGTITADELSMPQESAACGNVVLDAANDVDELAVSNTFTTGTVAFHDIDDLAIERASFLHWMVG